LSGQYCSEAPASIAANVEPFVEQGQTTNGTKPTDRLPAPADIIALISEWEKQRDDMMRDEGNETRNIKATCRRIGRSIHPGDDDKAVAATKKAADDLYKAIDAGAVGREDRDEEFSIRCRLQKRDVAHAGKLHCEGKLRALAKKLSIYSFVQSTRGFGEIGLAQIVGKCGDLSNYSNPAKVWKRMGLGIVDGKRQQCIAGDAALAIRHGYSPRRRSTMFVIGDSLLKCQGPYREIYLARKAYEVQKAEAAGLTVKPAAQIKKGEADKCMSQGHIHARAQRYMEKRLLRDLWIAWKNLHGLHAYKPTVH
jgi:hypothetical protein